MSLGFDESNRSCMRSRTHLDADANATDLDVLFLAFLVHELRVDAHGGLDDSRRDLVCELHELHRRHGGVAGGAGEAI